MNLVQSGSLFGFNYTDPNQTPSLNVAFDLYDSSSGSPVFLTQVVSSYSGFGSYVGTYTAAPGIQYTVIGAVYTDNTFTAVDTAYAPTSNVYQSFSGQTVTSIGFTYSTLDFSSTLPIVATVYDSTSGTPVFQSTVNLVYIDSGVYFGIFQGAISKNYQIVTIVYTDNTYTTVNFNYAPGSLSFDAIGTTPTPPSTLSSMLIDVTELLHDPNFVEGIALVTRVPTVNSLGENILSETTTNSIGCVQPTSGRDLLRLPEALRQMDVFTFWYQGIIQGSAPNIYPMILVFKGKRYQVQKILDWTSYGHGWTEGLATAEVPS
jgi:hypothetical protein